MTTTTPAKAKAPKPTPAQAAATLSDDVVAVGLSAFGVKTATRVDRVRAMMAARQAWPSDVTFSVVEYRARLVKAAGDDVAIDAQASLYRADQAGRAVAQIPAPASPDERWEAAIGEAIKTVLKSLDDGMPVKAVVAAVKAKAAAIPTGTQREAKAAEAVAKLADSDIGEALDQLDAAAAAKAATPAAKAAKVKRTTESLAADARKLARRLAEGGFDPSDATLRGAFAILTDAAARVIVAPKATPAAAKAPKATPAAAAKAAKAKAAA